MTAPGVVRPRPIRILLYCRISTASDGAGGVRSVDEQADDGHADVAEHAGEGWAVVKVFKDPALSAWDEDVERPEFEAAMACLEAGEADGIWVYELTRFTRQPAQGERLLRLAKRGVIVTSHDTRYDLQTAAGRYKFRDDLNASARESDLISQRSRRGKLKKAQRGRSNASFRGYGTPGYAPKPEGWQAGDLRALVAEEIVAAERETVRAMAARVLAGVSPEIVAGDLNEAGVPTPSPGKSWTATGIKQLLRRPSIAGLVEYKGQLIDGKTLPFEAALDRATWDALRALFESRRRGRAPAVYLLSGLARCGRCGIPLYGRPLTGRRPYPDGGAARQYWCMPRYSGAGVGCGRLVIDQRYADGLVEEAVLERLGDPRHTAQLAAYEKKLAAEHARVAKQLDEAEALGVALAGKLGRREMSQARYDAATEPLDRDIARYAAELRALEDGDGDDGGFVPAGLDVAAQWRDGDLAARRRMVRRAFPALAILPAQSRGKAALTPERFDWTGELAPLDLVDRRARPPKGRKGAAGR